MKNIIKFTKGKQNTYKVLIDTEEVVLFDDIVIKYELLLKKKISDSELDKIKKENNSLNSYYDALKYISKKMRTNKEIEEYLKKKEYSKDSILKTVKKLEKERILDDSFYVKTFLGDSIRLSLDGPNKIKRKLENLGIKEDIYESYFDEIDNSIWEEKVSKIIQKRQSSLHKESVSVWKQKLINYLITQGYSFESIRDKVDSILITNNPNIIIKEKEKIERKLSRKYTGNELDFQIKSKLYQKGFTREEIDEVIKK